MMFVLMFQHLHLFVAFSFSVQNTPEVQLPQHKQVHQLSRTLVNSSLVPLPQQEAARTAVAGTGKPAKTLQNKSYIYIFENNIILKRERWLHAHISHLGEVNRSSVCTSEGREKSSSDIFANCFQSCINNMFWPLDVRPCCSGVGELCSELPVTFKSVLNSQCKPAIIPVRAVNHSDHPKASVILSIRAWVQKNSVRATKKHSGALSSSSGGTMAQQWHDQEVDSPLISMERQHKILLGKLPRGKQQL